MLHATFSIVAAAALARIAILVMMASTAPIDDRASQAKAVSGTQSVMTVLNGSILSLLFWRPWIVLSHSLAIVGLLLSSLVLLWFRRKCLVRVGGTTGDLLGCSAYLIQLCILLTSSIQ